MGFCNTLRKIRPLPTTARSTTLYEALATRKLQGLQEHLAAIQGKIAHYHELFRGDLLAQESVEERAA